MCKSIPREVQLRHLRHLLAPIASLFEDAAICAILINGPYRVYAESAGRMQLTGCRFDGLPALQAVLRAVARCDGRELDASEASLVARLPDGSRLDAVMSQFATDGPLVAIRRPRERAYSLAQLVARGCLEQIDHGRLRAALASRSNVLVTGTHGSGKTVLLNALAAELPEVERVVVVESTHELRLSQPHVVRLRAKEPNADGARACKNLTELARRLRPDRIVLDVLDGGEALSLLHAMSEGHDGCLFALCARSPERALFHLERLALTAAPQLPVGVLRTQITAAVDLVVHTRRLADGSYRVTDVGEPRPPEAGDSERHGHGYALHPGSASRHAGA